MVAGPIENDPFEEFEFKPLTEGLGFHSQAKPAAIAAKVDAKSEFKSELKNENKVDSKIWGKPDLKFEARREVARTEAARSEKNYVDDLLDLNSLETGKLDQPLLRTPLLKRTNTANSELPPVPSSAKVDEVMKGLQKHNWDFKENSKTKAQRKALNAPPEFMYHASGYDLSAVVLDAMLVVAAFLGSLISLLMVTQIDLIAAISTASTEMLAATLGSLFAAICWVYLSVNRLFLGSTPGEWVFDQRLGPAEAQGSASYALKSVLRPTLIILTGLATLPLISMIVGRDLLGRLMNLELHQKSLK